MRDKAHLVSGQFINCPASAGLFHACQLRSNKRGTLSADAPAPMDQQLFWLAFKAGDDYILSPYLAESRQEALHHGMEHVLDQELAAVFTGELGFTEEQMLELAQVLPPPGSPLMRPSEA